MSSLSLVKRQRQFDSRIPFKDNPNSNLPSPHNPNYQITIHEKCPFGDTKKIFKTGWSLYYHLKYHHPNEQQNKEFVIKIIDKIICEALK